MRALPTFYPLQSAAVRRIMRSMLLATIFFVSFCLYADGSELMSAVAVTDEGHCLLSVPVALCAPEGPCMARESIPAVIASTPLCRTRGIEREPVKRKIVRYDLH